MPHHIPFPILSLISLFAVLVTIYQQANKKWDNFILMNQKAYLNHLTNNKQYLESFQLNDINISRSKVKLPFSRVTSNTIKLSQHQPQERKKQIVEFSPTFRKDGIFVVQALCADDAKKQVQNAKITRKNRAITIQDDDQNISNFYRSNSLPMKTYQILPKKQPKRRLSTQNNHYQLPVQKKISCLPKININKIPELLMMRKSIQRRKKQKKSKLSFIQKQKQEMIKNCYKSASKMQTNRSMSNSSSSRRLKTNQQAHNEYMLQKILTAKPTQELSRRNLDRKFELHRNYQRIREHKNCVWAGFQASMHTRSKTISVKHQYIKL